MITAKRSRESQKKASCSHNTRVSFWKWVNGRHFATAQHSDSEWYGVRTRGAHFSSVDQAHIGEWKIRLAIPRKVETSD
jgi:hypothetical protein